MPTTSLLPGLDDIFNTNNTVSKETSGKQTTNILNIFDSDTNFADDNNNKKEDIFSQINMLYGNNTSINGNSNNNDFNLFNNTPSNNVLTLEPTPSSNNNNNNNLKELFKNSEITILAASDKSDATNVTSTIYVSNNINAELTNVKLNLMAPKYIVVKVLQTLGTSLAPKQQQGIQKVYLYKYRT